MTRAVEFRQVDDGRSIAVGELVGDIDLAKDSSTRASLRAAFIGALAAEAPVIIDCSKVTFLALSGVRALLEAKQRYRPHSAS